MRNKLFFVLWGLPVFVYSQGRLIYTYDGAGNRSGRLVNTSLYTQLIENDTIQELLRDEYFQKEEFREEGLRYRKIRIAPNPTTGKFKVTLDGFDDKDKCILRLYTVDGTLLSSIDVKSAITLLDITSQPVGLYLLCVRLNDKETTWKLIKK